MDGKIINLHAAEVLGLTIERPEPASRVAAGWAVLAAAVVYCGTALRGLWGRA